MFSQWKFFKMCPFFVRIFALITRQDSAQIFTKMSPDEELVTLHWQHQDFRNYSSVPTSPVLILPYMLVLGQKCPYFCDFGILP